MSILKFLIWNLIKELSRIIDSEFFLSNGWLGWVEVSLDQSWEVMANNFDDLLTLKFGVFNILGENVKILVDVIPGYDWSIIRQWLVIEVKGGRDDWLKSVSIGTGIVGVSNVGAWVGIVGISLLESYLEQLVDPEFACWDA
jgi:hypothetical protein